MSESTSFAHPVQAAPLDRRWLALIDRLAPRVLGRDDRSGSALAAEVARLSELYTRERDSLASAGSALAARLRFFLPRDLPKIQAPLAELAAVGALPPGPRWRVLDVGAGLGTTTLGAAELARRAGVSHLEVTALERDRASLDVFEQLAREAAAAELLARIDLRGRRGDVERLEPSTLPEVDLVLVGLSLNELYADREPAARLEALEATLRALAGRLAPGGALIVLEPALREVTRRLMQLRDRFALEPGAATLFAPCLRDGSCPMLPRERDWCHDQLPFELPDELGALAARAGLRSERLTFAYLTLSRAERRLWDLSGRRPTGLRIVGGPVGSKGKTEWEGCGAPGLVRLRRLDRERSADNAGLDDAARGAIVEIEALDSEQPRHRVRPDHRVERHR